MVYFSCFVAFIAVIASGYENPTDQPVKQVVASSATDTDNKLDLAVDAPSIDEIVSTDIAASIAERTNLPIAPSIAERAVSLSVKNDLAQTDDTVVSKPQIVEVSEGQRNIRKYKVKKGDSVQDVVAKFDVSARTIKWANNLESDALTVGKTLTIPPVDGIIHKVDSGETIAKIARDYKTSAARIVSYNDLEFSKPKNGQKLIIPNGILPEESRPDYVPPTPIYPTYGSNFSGSVSGSFGNIYNASAGNRYAPGNCTWYAYERRAELGRPIGSFWGDGGSWAYSAQAAGYLVNSNPLPGALMVTLGSPGHVAVVESVKSNGDIALSDMNYAGFNVITNRTMTKGQAASYLYIHDRR